jgi:F0F1-type ATP synthase assembly protein I
MLEILSTRIGGFSIYLGIMLFFNLYLFFRGRRISRERARLAETLNKIPSGNVK